MPFNIKKIIGFAILLLVFKKVFEFMLIGFFASAPFTTAGIWLIVTLAAFGLWNVPQFIRALFCAKPSV